MLLKAKCKPSELARKSMNDDVTFICKMSPKKLIKFDSHFSPDVSGLNWKVKGKSHALGPN